MKISNKFILCDHVVNSHNHSLIDITYILLDVLLSIVVSLQYFSSSAVSYIPTTSKNIQRYHRQPRRCVSEIMAAWELLS